MRSAAPPLLPIFRSRLQGELLALVLRDADAEWTVSELAQTLGAPLTSVQSEVSRLQGSSLLLSRKQGRNRLVRANPANPLTAPLTQLVLLAFGPRWAIAEAFGSLHADRVLIFGSWAARLAGESGGAPADIDVLVVGDDIPRADAYAAAERAEQLLGLPVNPVLRSSSAWDDPRSDPLLDEILRRPHIDVSGPAAEIQA